MAKGLIEHATMTAIADAIRAKSETSDKIIPSNMASMISALSGGAEMLTGTVTPTNVNYEDAIFSLGVSLPTSDNYTFVAGLFEGATGQSGGDVLFALLKNAPDGSINQVTCAADGGSVPIYSVYSDQLYFDAFNGISRLRSKKKFAAGKKYWWCYIYG